MMVVNAYQFEFFADILESVLEKHQHLVTATPPPSPILGQSATKSENFKSRASLFSASSLKTGI